MRIQVEHDKDGKVVAVAIPYERPGQVAYAALRPRPGLNVAYVEARELTSEQDLEKIHELKREFRVQHREGLHRLVRQ